VHNEEMTGAKVRILQLWLTLSKEERWAEPRFERIEGASAPVRRERGAKLTLYSGTSGGLSSPTRNHVPTTLAEIELEPGATLVQELPADYNGFVYVVEGSVRAGSEGPRLVAGQVGWLDRPEADGPVDGPSELKLTTGESSARLVLYAGRPTGDPIVHQGP